MPRSAAVLARLATPAAVSTSDAQLLRTFVASQHEDAFAELVHRHGPMVFAVCRRVLGDAHDAEDAFQATFLVLARKAGSIHSANLSAWLHGVALRTARGVRVMRDRRRKHALQSQESGAKSQSEPAPDSSLALLEQAAIIDEELAKLPDYYRDAIVMCELRGLSRRQAAAELDICEGTLSSRLASAKRKLAARLSARGLTGAVALTVLLAPAAVPAALQESTALAVRGAAGSVAGAAASTVMKGMLFEQLRTAVLTVVVLAGAVCGGLAMTGSPSTDAPRAKGVAALAPVPHQVEDRAPALVKQLGSDDFATRETAEKELRKLGSKAEAALKAGLKSDNPEIRARCPKILAAIRKDALNTLINDFDPLVENQPDHPIWKRFQAVAGNTRASRALFMTFVERSRFAVIQADNNWLARLDAAETSPEAAARQYREVAIGFARRARENMRIRFFIPVWPCDMADEAAFLLFLGTYPGTRDLPGALTEGEKQLFREGEDRLFYARGVQLGLRGEMLETGKFDPKVVKGPAGMQLAFAKLFTAWLERRDPTSSVMPSSLWLAAKNGVKEALPLARTLAADKFPHKRLPPPALYAGALAVIGQFGTPDDLPLFERHFKNTMDIASQEPSVPPGAKAPPTLTAKLRDAAFGLALLLCDQDPFAFGFTNAKDCFRRENERPVLAKYEPINFGFPDDKARAAAHAKAKAFLDKQKPAPKKDESEPDPALAKLVEQLGSDDFATREAAEKQLKELGSKARGVLEAGLKSDKPEVVKRCRELLGHLARAEFEAKHWPRFAKVIGEDKASRVLFNRIRSERRNVELLDAVAADPKAAGKLYDDRWLELNKAANVPLPGGGATLNPAPLADVVGWMYLGTFPGAGGAFHTSHSIDFLPFLPASKNAPDPLSTALRDETVSPALRRLIGKWTAARVDYSGRGYGYEIALVFDIEEVLPAARETVAAKVKDDPSPGNTARNVGFAMLVMGKLGSKGDLPLLEKYAANADHCSTVLNDPPPEPGQPQIWLRRLPKDGQDATGQLRDVSVAMRLHLLGQNPDEFGFYWQNPHSTEKKKPVAREDRFTPYRIGFTKEADRVVAHKKAQEWFDKQKK